MNLPSRLFSGVGSDDHELSEEDGEFVLTVKLPGFEPEETEVNWHDDGLRYPRDPASNDSRRA